jgi:hypothetical protein
VILIGIDDTDMPETRGTNQLARAIVRAAGPAWRLHAILRHQLLDDPRVPYTSQNGSASIALEPVSGSLPELIATCRRVMQEDFIEGSDPGLCLVERERVSAAVIAWGRRCREELVTKAEALALAESEQIHLEALGGTGGGVIGALAAVGLAVEADSGRIVQWREWPDDLSGVQPLSAVLARGIHVRRIADGSAIERGDIDVGKHLRPNIRRGGAVLFVEPNPVGECEYKAVKQH